jgi:hypothetical protein
MCVVALFNVHRSLKFARHYKQNFMFVFANILSKVLFLTSSIVLRLFPNSELSYMAVFGAIWLAFMINAGVYSKSVFT